uniref:RanBP2-type domain-containing protein n=1 Tax=Pyxicephalus adspersus TaxID=30357 RepID=A0AAV2ZK93_PYXAD|nr:TPA: hypothetical protein GDO54_016600 [Pyxicephalus adspersus]
MRDREVAALSLKNRETASLSFRGREVVEFTERRLPAHVGESADLDLRMTEPDKSMDFLGRDMGSVAVSYRKEDKMVLEYMEVEHQEIEALNTGKDTAGFTPMDKESAEMPYRQGGTSCVKNYDKGESQTQRPEFQKHTDTDYREKECADSDYREKESSDSDYRGRENADLNYRDTKTADSDYREKEPADSDYRERESTDTDYRQNAEDYSKESTDKIDTERDFLASNLEEDKKGLPGEVKSTTDYPLIPTEMEKTGPQEIIPFLAFSEEELSSLTKMIVDTKTKPPAEVPARSRSDPSCPGKLDIDFRDRSNQEDGNSGTKERAEKPLGYTAHGSTPDELCIGDQDLRSKDCFAKEPNKVEGDQDLRTSGHGQKDEDLRGGETKSNEEFFTQNYLLLDFLRLAAKELRDKTTEGDEEHVALTPPIPEPSTAKPFLPDIITRPARPLGTGSTIVPSIDFLCREDTDYRSMDFNDVDLRVGHRPEKRSREESQPGSKDKDYRRTPVPEGATKIIWLDGLPTGASREDILCALGSVHKLPEGVNLIGYIPGYSFGSVCVEFSLVEEAVGFMEANKGVLHFRGKRVTLKYIPNSDRWTCLQCKAVNALSKERCWQCSALRAGTDHLSLRDAHKEPKTPPSTSTQRSKKRKSKHSPSGRSPDRWKEITPPREKSPQPKTSKGAKEADSESATVIIRGIGVNTSPDSVVKVLQPFAQLSPSNVRIMRNRKSNRPRYGMIDLKNHKEAIRLTVLVRDLKEPLTIDGKAISVDLAVDQRKNEQGKSPKGNKSGPSKQKSDSYSSWDPERDRKETSSHTRRGFKEEKETEEEAFKKPLPPPMVKKEERAEPKVNPLLGLIGAYAEDSDDEEQDEETLPPLRKKPAPLLPPATTPKPVPKPVPIPMPKPEPKPVPSISDDNKLTDWKKMICLLCRRQFPSKEALIRHQTFSDLHKQNIAIHEKIRKSQKELEYLQQREQEENKCIQRRLQQAKKELEMLEREEEGATQVRLYKKHECDLSLSPNHKASPVSSVHLL